MGVPIPKSVHSRIRVIPSDDPFLEGRAEVLEPGDEGYEEADEPSGSMLVDLEAAKKESSSE